MRLILSILALAAGLAAQTQQPPDPHYTVLTWTWDQGSGGVATGFKIYRAARTGDAGTLVKTITDPTIKTWTDTDAAVLVDGATNYYTITAYNASAESARSQEVPAVTPFRKPGAPGPVSAEAH